MGKKFYSYSATKANFIGRFPNFYTVDEVAYRKKKKESLSKDVDELGEDAEMKKMFNDWLFLKLQNPSLEMKEKVKAQLIGTLPKNYTMKAIRYRKNLEKGELV